MQKNPRIWWLCGWFPASSSPFAGNFIWRHALAVWRNLGSTELILFHFPTFLWGGMPPKPVGDDSGEWMIDTRYSLNYGYRWQEKGGNEDLVSGGPFSLSQNASIGKDGGELLLYFRPIVQFRSKFLSPINFLYYTIIVLYRLWRMNAILGKPKVIHLHVADKIGMPFWILKQLIWSKVRTYYTEHWAIFGTPVQDRYEKRNPVFRYYFRKVWANIDVAASISVFTHQWMQRTFHVAKRMIFFPNVVDTEQFKIQTLESETVQINLLHVSNFESRKRVLEIIAAFQFWKENMSGDDGNRIKLTLVGAEREVLEKRIVSAENVGFLIHGKHQKIDLMDVDLIWKGKLVSEKVAEQMKSSHALVLFSTAENAPCVISEALCCGLPVISNRLAGIPEMLMHGENGVLIEDRIEALVMAIDALIHHYGFNRDYIAKAAHRNYAPKFAVQELIESYQVEIHGGVS